MPPARRRSALHSAQINKATGNRVRQQLIDEETREPVASEHKGRGYEVAKGIRSCRMQPYILKR
jgi:DNA end-binding protein Ku